LSRGADGDGKAGGDSKAAAADKTATAARCAALPALRVVGAICAHTPAYIEVESAHTPALAHTSLNTPKKATAQNSPCAPRSNRIERRRPDWKLTPLKTLVFHDKIGNHHSE
jgi:hypothetical protein